MRVISKIIIHCSATLPFQPVSVADIRSWHKERGFIDVGYHYIIDIDGTIHVGRPVDKIGAHCAGYNAHSIGICYIGGLDEQGNPCDTRTSAQISSLRSLIDILRGFYPNVSIHGHNEFSDKACPCFDVKSELSKFNP